MKKTVVLSILLGFLALAASAQKKPFSVIEAGIPEMQKAMREKRVTSRELVQQYLTRIATYDDKLHATISVNPNALKEAEELGAARVFPFLRDDTQGVAKLFGVTRTGTVVGLSCNER